MERCVFLNPQPGVPRACPDRAPEEVVETEVRSTADDQALSG